MLPSITIILILQNLSFPKMSVNNFAMKAKQKSLDFNSNSFIQHLLNCLSTTYCIRELKPEGHEFVQNTYQVEGHTLNSSAFTPGLWTLIPGNLNQKERDHDYDTCEFRGWSYKEDGINIKISSSPVKGSYSLATSVMPWSLKYKVGLKILQSI